MALLEARGVTVRFGGNVAAQDVDLDVEPGRITGLIGPNGAGKTTTFNALCGLQQMAGGRIMLDGDDITKLPAHKRARRGLARTFQRLEVFTLLSVRENILAGAEIRRTWVRRAGHGARGDDRSPEEITDELIERLGLTDVAEERVDSLPTGRARLVELGRALAAQPRLVLLDEVSSGLNETETEAMAEVLRGLARDGLGILLVEHDMSLVMSTCDDIYVLDFGEIIAVGPPKEIQGNARVQEAYLGSSTEKTSKSDRRSAGSSNPPSARPPRPMKDRLAPIAENGWRRLGAALIDMAILAAFAALGLALTTALAGDDRETLELDLLTVLVAGLLPMLAFFAISWSFWAEGKTPGKSFVGLRTVDSSTGEPLDRRRMALREVLWKGFVNNALYGLTSGIGPIVAGALVLTERRQSLWDRLTSTYVIPAEVDVMRTRTARRRAAGEEIPVLEVRSVSAGYGDFDVLDGVEFSLRTGEVFALLGPNGAGKSTTLKVIAGLLPPTPPTAGQVAICGRAITGADPDELARAGVCLVPEGKGIFPNLTVAENLQMATFTGTSRSDVEDRAYSRFPRLAERRSQVAGTLSGGEQQMLSMARALATDPSLLLLDELSMGLAPIIVQGLYEQVAEIAREGLSIVVVEQFAHEVLGVADTAAIMLHGKIRRVGPPEQIADELAEAYLSGSTG